MTEPIKIRKSGAEFQFGIVAEPVGTWNQFGLQRPHTSLTPEEIGNCSCIELKIFIFFLVLQSASPVWRSACSSVPLCVAVAAQQQKTTVGCRPNGCQTENQFTNAVNCVFNGSPLATLINFARESETHHKPGNHYCISASTTPPPPPILPCSTVCASRHTRCPAARLHTRHRTLMRAAAAAQQPQNSAAAVLAWRRRWWAEGGVFLLFENACYTESC